MKELKENRKTETPAWEEESGLILFLASVNREVEKFNKSFEFGINNMAVMPGDIDGDSELPLKAGFMLGLKNPLLPELTYCLYAILKGRVLYGYIGLYRDGGMTTLKELAPMSDFREGNAVLYEWLTQLVRASYEKIML